MEKKEYKLAINELNDAISKEPDYAEAYLERGKCILSNHVYSEVDSSLTRNKFQLAISDFTKAIDLNPDLMNEALHLRSNIYWITQDYKKAETDLEELLKIDSTKYSVISLLANTKSKLGDTEGAKKLFDSIIKKDPLNSESYFGRALWKLLNYNDKKGGCKDLAEAERLYDNNSIYSTNFLLDRIHELQKINCNK
jgi:tetratricopeptide (TPR) repeat protein